VEWGHACDLRLHVVGRNDGPNGLARRCRRRSQCLCHGDRDERCGFCKGDKRGCRPGDGGILAWDATSMLLFGDQTVESTTDTDPAGLAQSFQYTAASDAQIYVDGSSTAANLLVGVYSNSGGNPGSLVARFRL